MTTALNRNVSEEKNYQDSYPFFEIWKYLLFRHCYLCFSLLDLEKMNKKLAKALSSFRELKSCLSLNIRLLSVEVGGINNFSIVFFFISISYSNKCKRNIKISYLLIFFIADITEAG